MGDNMLIDLHEHTSGISTCCLLNAREILNAAAESGLDGVVITNHYHKDYITDGDYRGFAERYIAEYRLAEELGKKCGIRVFHGIEVTAELYPNVHILIYGVDDDFIYDNIMMFDYTQKQLYERVKQYGGAIVQAHPFRNGATVLDTRYLDGVEINCHPKYKNSFEKELIEIATKNSLIVTCGGDYHGDVAYRPKCGMYLPYEIETSDELCKYILNASEVKLCVHEPEAATPHDTVYGKPN